MAYNNRLADSILKEMLEAKGAVLVEGAKWCGKTTTAEQLANSCLYMQDPAKKEQNLQLANLNPSILLEGKTPRLIDEWQDAPSIWDAVRYSIDKEGLRGQYILTGSATPSDFGVDGPRHTGTGRISRMRLRTMSLFESGESNGTVSLAELFKGNKDAFIREVKLQSVTSDNILDIIGI